MFRLPVRGAMAALALPVFLSSLPLPAQAAPASDLRFTVLRNGEETGHHTISFHPAGGDMDVAIDTSVVVTVAMIPVYRFEHHGEEHWHNGQLASLSSTTNDDGSRHQTKVTTAADGSLQAQGDKGSWPYQAGSLPASLWNVETVHQGILLNTLDGHPMKVSFSDLGEDNVTVHGHQQAAHHYAMHGDLERELWYDAGGMLVQVQFKAKDDSGIRYILK